EQNDVGLHLGMRNFEGDGASGARVDGAENGGHAAARHQIFDPVVVQHIAGMEGIHAMNGPGSQRSLYGRPRYMPTRSTLRMRINWTLILSLPSRSLARPTSRSAAAVRSEARPTREPISSFCRAPCRPSEQSTSRSPGRTWWSLDSTPTNMSVPSERLSRW